MKEKIQKRKLQRHLQYLKLAQTQKTKRQNSGSTSRQLTTTQETRKERRSPTSRFLTLYSFCLSLCLSIPLCVSFFSACACFCSFKHDSRRESATLLNISAAGFGLQMLKRVSLNYSLSLSHTPKHPHPHPHTHAHIHKDTHFLLFCYRNKWQCKKKELFKGPR